MPYPEDKVIRNVIYALLCPKCGVPRYIGQTCHGFGRYKKHISRPSNYHVGRWIKKLQSKELQPVWKILIELPESNQLDAAEIFWIDEAKRRNWPLTNHVAGGGGMRGWHPSEQTKAKIAAANKGYIASPEARAKISATHKGRKKSPEHVAKLLAKLHSPEAKAKSLANRVPLSEEQRKSISDRNRGRINSSETIEKMRQAALRRPPPSDALKKKWSAQRMGHKNTIWTEDDKIKLSKSRGGKSFQDSFGNIFHTLTQAALKYNAQPGKIWMVLNGQRKSTRGTTFKYLEANL